MRHEGDPQRVAGEQQAMGGVPTYGLDVASGNLSVSPHSNPMQFIVLGSGLGTLRCSVPSKPGMDLCGPAGEPVKGTRVALGVLGAIVAVVLAAVVSMWDLVVWWFEGLLK